MCHSAIICMHDDHVAKFQKTANNLSAQLSFSPQIFLQLY
jgi:hypothetical protein